jgi:hypothetical protein
MKRCLLWTAVLSGFILPQSGANGAGQAKNAYSPYVTITGSDSHVTKPLYCRAASEAEWLRIWQRHKGAEKSDKYDSFYDPLGFPVVDFDKCMVVAIFTGSTWNCAGLKFAEIQETKDSIVFRYRSKDFQTFGNDGNGGGRRVNAYGFFVVPRSSKVMILEEDAHQYKGDPPLWKERFRTAK